jgi:hypothetical protein
MARRRCGTSSGGSSNERRETIPLSGLASAEVGDISQAAAGLAQKKIKKMSWAAKAIGPNWQWAAKNSFHNFQTKI